MLHSPHCTALNSSQCKFQQSARVCCALAVSCRGVGEAMTSLGDTEGGRKGTGVDFSNAAEWAVHEYQIMVATGVIGGLY